MRKVILDTSILVNYWRKRGGRRLENLSAEKVRAWARELIAIERTRAIVTPVYLEFFAGVMSAHELTLAKAFLGEFEIVDGWRILDADWKRALRYAQWFPKHQRQRSGRQLGDCLIRAICDRLKCDVRTPDRRFPPTK